MTPSDLSVMNVIWSATLSVRHRVGESMDRVGDPPRVYSIWIGQRSESVCESEGTHLEASDAISCA